MQLLPFEAFYPTRLFCAVSLLDDDDDDDGGGDGAQPSGDDLRGYCASCLTDCAFNADSAEGSCVDSCGLPPLSSFPRLGLPDPLRSLDQPGGLWPVVALIDAQSLFASALWKDVGTAEAEAALEGYLSPVELAAASVDSDKFSNVLTRSRMGGGRSPSEVAAMFQKMDIKPFDQRVTPLE
jgi:hypothetical protein